MSRLSNDELADRVRARNIRRMISYRERKAEKGLQHLAVWIPSELKQQIDITAGLSSRTLSEETTVLLREALNYRDKQAG